MKWFKSDKENESKSKSSETKEVVCPHCDFEQSVSSKVELTFCKNCNKIINTKQISEPKRIKPATMPSASAGAYGKAVQQESSITAVSKKETGSNAAMPPPLSQRPVTILGTGSTEERPSGGGPAMPEPEQKEVVCSHCKTEQKVPAIALSSFCKKCGQRINLQDYEIKGKFQGELETRGVICIAQGADVTAEVNVGSAIVMGKIRGNIVAETRVELKKTGIVFGTITSPTLLVDDGAIFVGKAIINPKTSPKK